MLCLLDGEIPCCFAHLQSAQRFAVDLHQETDIAEAKAWFDLHQTPHRGKRDAVAVTVLSASARRMP
jgi:hypothetical protein